MGLSANAKSFPEKTYLNGFEYFTSVITVTSVNVFRNATKAALSCTDKFINLG